MMRQMRENTKWIMLITAAAFVALMVFEWGMDASGTSAGAGNVGRVGGTNVSVIDYQNVYRNLYDQISRSQDQPISTQQNREIEDMAWEQVVTQILIQKELDRRGIRVTADEIRQAVRFSPPPELRNDPNFQTDGQFDMERYQAFLAQATQDPQFVQQLEQYYRDAIPRSKLLRQLTSGIHVSDAQLWQEWRDRHERAEVTFVTLQPGERISDAEVEVTRDEVERYYRDHREEFAVPARANLRYTYMSKAPTDADSLAVMDRLEGIHQRLQEGADFADVADLESADRETAPEGGLLGTVARGQAHPALDEAIFSLPVGEVSEPIRSDQGWHILEVLSRDEDEAEVRHILIPMERTDDSEIRLLTRADSLESMGRNMPVADAAAELGLPVREGEITEDFAILAGVGPADEGQDWIFEEQEEGPGAVSPVFENQETFYMVEILRMAPAGYLSLEQVSAEIESRLRLQKKLERAEEEARGLVAELRNGLSLEELAEREGLEVQTAGPFSRVEPVPGLGLRNAAVGAAFGRDVGEVAGPVRVQDRVIILRVDDRIEADREAWEEQKSLQRMQKVAQIRQERLERWLDGLREVTRIQDNRREYFRMVEEQDDSPQIPMAF
jgi:peptidyl-prolyl cis-trans isomerase D